MRRPSLMSVGEGDARSLPFADQQVDVVLLLGPLDHLTNAADRARALSEAVRVLNPGGLLFAACITCWASLIEGLLRDRLSDEGFVAMTKGGSRLGSTGILHVTQRGSRRHICTGRRSSLTSCVRQVSICWAHSESRGQPSCSPTSTSVGPMPRDGMR